MTKYNLPLLSDSRSVTCGIILIDYYSYILQVDAANAPLKTFAVCSRLSIVEDDTTDVLGLGPGDRGAPPLQIMMWINCLDIVAGEVKSSLHLISSLSRLSCLQPHLYADVQDEMATC